MTLTNHLLTGAVLAKFLPLPVAIPLAFASHFVLDALPHFGSKTVEERMNHMRLFRAIIILDVFAAVALSGWLINNAHTEWLLVGLLAYSPDLLWVYRFTVKEKFGKVKPTLGGRFIQFHRNIQKYERSWGIIVEVIYSLLIFSAIRSL